MLHLSAKHWPLLWLLVSADLSFESFQPQEHQYFSFIFCVVGQANEGGTANLIQITHQQVLISRYMWLFAAVYYRIESYRSVGSVLHCMHQALGSIPSTQ